jgi:hypothetical protein
MAGLVDGPGVGGGRDEKDEEAEQATHRCDEHAAPSVVVE